MKPDDFDGMPLAEFVRIYEEDDNHWWVAACGHHQNWFEEAIDELEVLRSVIRILDVKVAIHKPNDHHLAMAEDPVVELTPEQWAAVARSKERHGNRDDDPGDL